MDPGVKLAAALSVLVTAVCLALLFWSDPGSLAPPTSQPLTLRAESELPLTPLRPSRKPDLFFPLPEPGREAVQQPTVLMPATPVAEAPPYNPEGRPLPASNRSAPNTEEQSSWGTAAGVKMPELHRPPGDAGQPSPRTHTVVDGDTLAGLALRYLGTVDRYLEIYHWNSDVLANPDVLPIGQLLRIPPRDRPQEGPAQVIERPLVPITESSPE
ncbi:MAG: LysM peptidoglycan-binding domain-containing protein [Thermoguttaceae bacterium]|jgi:nucleoid-associated protein YgaU|nr:LysM peptidoglycan-binding domain-containing protein [Thermoguttaceae bacterium]